jgi:hypothetical protein
LDHAIRVPAGVFDTPASEWPPAPETSCTRCALDGVEAVVRRLELDHVVLVSDEDEIPAVVREERPDRPQREEAPLGFGRTRVCRVDAGEEEEGTAWRES